LASWLSVWLGASLRTFGSQAAMAPRSCSRFSLVLLVAACLATLLSDGFVGPRQQVRSRDVVRPAAQFESGKVNMGVEVQADVPPPPQPVRNCDEGCMMAINDCLEEGCCVEALTKLDAKLATDEQQIVESVEVLRNTQKTAFSEENADTLAWLRNFLSRSGALRAQLQALKGLENIDFVQQMVKAAAVGFGGGRKSDYPKVGVSPYSS